MSTAIVLGTRPELVKMAPVLEALESAGERVVLVHTGQHYDENLSGDFFRDLGIRQPDHYLGVGSGAQGYQTAQCIMRLEEVFSRDRPKVSLVQGDTNTVLAGALASVKMGVPVGHVEAGLRSNDRRMPEEYNRRVADHVSHLLFAPTKESAKLLRDEKCWGKIFVTGNTVIDACEKFAPLADRKSVAAKRVRFDDFILVTAHRAENVDDRKVLAGLVKVLSDAPLPVVYPLHPRTKKRLEEFGLYDRLASSANVQLMPPIGYLDFLALMRRCTLILTDSGGIQEEATSPSIRKRVLVFRKSTERPEAVKAGFARVVGVDAPKVAKALAVEIRAGKSPKGRSPYGDGKAGHRIAKIVVGFGG